MAAPADLELLHRSFARCLRAENRSAGTIYVYGLAIRQLADYLAGLPDPPPGRTADMQRQPIEDFIGSLADEGIAGATLNNRYRSLNRFFGYLLEASGFRTWRSCVRDVRHIWRTSRTQPHLRRRAEPSQRDYARTRASRLPCLHRYRFAVVGMIRRRRGSGTWSEHTATSLQKSRTQLKIARSTVRSRPWPLHEAAGPSGSHVFCRAGICCSLPGCCSLLVCTTIGCVEEVAHRRGGLTERPGSDARVPHRRVDPPRGRGFP